MGISYPQGPSETTAIRLSGWIPKSGQLTLWILSTHLVLSILSGFRPVNLKSPCCYSFMRYSNHVSVVWRLRHLNVERQRFELEMLFELRATHSRNSSNELGFGGLYSNFFFESLSNIYRLIHILTTYVRMLCFRKLFCKNR